MPSYELTMLEQFHLRRTLHVTWSVSRLLQVKVSVALGNDKLRQTAREDGEYTLLSIDWSITIYKVCT